MNNDRSCCLADAACRRHIERCVACYAKTSHDREDLVQDACCALVKSLRRNGPPLNLQAFATRVCQSVCIDYLRRLYREGETRGISQVAEPYYSDPPMERLIEKEQVETALDRVRDLPRRYRRAFTLGVLSELESKHVGRLLGVPPSTVGTWIMRARLILAEAVE